MAQLTPEDLKSYASSYESTREVGDVLIGEDPARPILDAVSSGNHSALQSLLSQPQNIKLLLEETPHRIYEEDSKEGLSENERRVMAAPTLNLEWAVTLAAQNGSAEAATALSTVLACAKQQKDINVSAIVNSSLMNQIIRDGHAPIVKALVTADPQIANLPLLHGALPLYEAVRLRQPDIVAVLLESGANPSQDPKHLHGYRSSLLSWAAYAKTPRITELLLQHNVPIANSAALHTAASTGALETMRVLIEHGADVNEALERMRGWTPLHFAGSRGRVEAMRLLEERGARADARNDEGKTAGELLAEREE